MPSESHRHIIGTEMEWGLLGRLIGEKKFLPLNGHEGMPSASPMAQDYLPPYLVKQPNAGTFLSNGSRYYHDTGGHIEYATPETISLDDIVLSELAGEKIVAESLQRFIADSVKLEEAILQRRVVDDQGETWGYHVNISEERGAFAPEGKTQDDFERQMAQKLQPLVFHYAASTPIIGGGAVRITTIDNKTTYDYSMSQKIIQLEEDINKYTTVRKPFISTRDEPHVPEADKSKYIRVHIIGLDPHVSPWATKVAIGSSILMLTGIRQGKIRQLEYAVPVPHPGIHIAKRAIYDIEGANRYPFIVSGKEKQYSDADIEEMYLQDLEKVTDKTEDMEWAFAEWKQAVADRKADVMRLADRSDAIAKYGLIQELNARRHQAGLDARAAAYDKMYTATLRVTKEDAKKMDSDTLLARSLPSKLRKGRFAAAMPEQIAIDDRAENAPTTTRAHRRGDIIRRWKELNINSVNWSSYSILVDKVSKTTHLSPWDAE